MPDFSNYHHAQADNLKFLYEALGVRELFERVNDLDSKGDGTTEVKFNPTDDPMVQPNLEGVGTPSGGPNSENSEETALSRKEAEKAAAEEKKTTSRSSSSSSSSSAKK